MKTLSLTLKNCYISALALTLFACVLTACSEADEQAVPEGYGGVTLRLTAPFGPQTRATGDWLDPVSTDELIHDYWVVFVSESDRRVAQIVEGDAQGAEYHDFRFMLPAGKYILFAFANISADTFESLNIIENTQMPDLTAVRYKTVNGWSGQIPMSNDGRQEVTVAEQENQSFEVPLTRIMAKLERQFRNTTGFDLDILGWELSPLEKTSVPLLAYSEEQRDKEALTTDTTTFKQVLSTPLRIAKGGNGTITTYINETNATATTTENQYSLRLKVRRSGAKDILGNDVEGVEEVRFGITLPKEEEGFSIIHRNDWIRIPVELGNWQFRIECLPFPPIAGFQSRVESADATSVTFETGGYVVLCPMFRRTDDPAGVWRNFSDGSVVFKPTGTYTKKDDNTYEDIDSETKTGIIIRGDMRIFEPSDSQESGLMLFKQIDASNIVGELLTSTPKDYKRGQVTITLKVQLGDYNDEGTFVGYHYQFDYNILR